MMKTKRILVIGAMLTIVSLMASATVKQRHGRGKAEQADSGCVDNSADARKRVGSQATAPLKATGSPKIPVILVQFSDTKFISGLGTSVDGEGKTVPNQCLTEADETVVNTFFSKFCNGEGGTGYYTGGGCMGAIKEYFRDQSYGKFTPEFTIIGPITLDKGYAYYGAPSGSKKDSNLNDFYKESIQKAKQKYSNWNAFDNDNNNIVDMAFFIFAGPGQNGDGDDDTIWPHERQNGGSYDGVTFGCYACCNETYKGTTDGIGVFVHELSHALGLPDFYDTNYVAYGLDYWDVMDSGCYCDGARTPCNYTAYERDFMGWKSLETLSSTSGARALTLKSLSDGGVGYKIVNPENANEYYVIENRQSTGWDAWMGQGPTRNINQLHGLMVMHVDYNASLWRNNDVNTVIDHQHITLVPADGKLDSYMYVDDRDDFNAFLRSAYGDLYPGLTHSTELVGEMAYVYTATGATPHQMNQPLTDITETNDIITLTYMGIPSAIETLFANKKVGLPIYNIAGVQVGTTDIEYGKPLNLPAAAGLYIVGGKKYIVK